MERTAGFIKTSRGIIDREEPVGRLLPQLDEMVNEGLIAMSDVEVIRYSRSAAGT